MQIFEGEHDCREVESSDVWREPLSASQVCEELSPRNVGQQHVDVEAILKGGIEIDDERMSYAGHNVALRVDMFHLSQSDDLRLAEDLESETIDGSRLVGRATESNEQHTPERASTWVAIGAVRTKTHAHVAQEGSAARCDKRTEGSPNFKVCEAQTPG